MVPRGAGRSGGGPASAASVLVNVVCGAVYQLGAAAGITASEPAQQLEAMTYLIGTDEAGYGPNLGPLVVSATLWRVADGIQPDALYDILEPVVCASAPRNGSTDGRLAVADSKALYKPGHGLRLLEIGVLAALALTGRRPATWTELFDALDPHSAAHRSRVPWYVDYERAVPPVSIPVACCGGELKAMLGRLEPGLQAAGVALLGLRSRVVFPEQFNGCLTRCRSKGEALSKITFSLVADMMGGLDDGPIDVVCDKHGGRNRYAEMLSSHFPEHLIEIHGEGRELSLYRFGPSRRRTSFCFRTRAEAILPVALASMTAKYLRELAMAALNAWWCEKVPGLRPTAGYPTDARRFKADVAEIQTALGIEDVVLWRDR